MPTGSDLLMQVRNRREASTDQAAGNDNLLGALRRSLRLAWPVLVIFLAQRLLTLAFLQHEGGSLRLLTTRWDAGWYLRLAEGGYVYPVFADDGSPRASNLAYFPLFPWLVRGAAALTPLSLAQALIAVAWLGGLLAAWAVFAVGHSLYGRTAGVALATLWGAAPASLTLTMGYPEGWFTAAAAAAVLSLMHRQPVWAGACIAVAGLLRPSVIALVAMMGVYLVAQLLPWLLRRRGRLSARDLTFGQDPPPVPALVGAALAASGLGAFMIYVGVRTGEVFGYFTVQSQWGQRSAVGAEYWRALEQGLFTSPAGSFVPVTLVTAAGYLVLFCLVAPDRRLVWGTVYAAGILLLALTHVTFQHVYARQLLPGFVLLIPLVRLRAPRIGALTALVLVSVLMSWGSAHFLLTRAAAM